MRWRLFSAQAKSSERQELEDGFQTNGAGQVGISCPELSMMLGEDCFNLLPLLETLLK